MGLAITSQSCSAPAPVIAPIDLFDGVGPFNGEGWVEHRIPKYPLQQVLGQKFYKDGTLLRAPNKRIYVVVGGKLLYIPTLIELKKYSGKEIIDVSQAVIDSYVKLVLGLKKYTNGSLLRGPNNRIYVLINDKKQHIKTLEELKKKYKNKPIFNVSEEILNQY